MLKAVPQVGKEVWTDISFVIVIHLLLLSLYAFVRYNLFHSPATSKPRYPSRSTDVIILGVCI